MHSAYKDDKELCKWLRENSSGVYRLSAYAAERIETLTAHLDNVQKECDRLESMEKYAPDMLEALEYCLDCLGDEFALPIDCIDKARAAIAKARGESE